MVDRGARDELIGRLARLLSGEIDVRGFGNLRSLKTKDRTVRRLADDLAESHALALPTRPGAPRDGDVSVSLQQDVQRAILFLRTDLDYRDPDGGWSWTGVAVIGGFAVGAICLIASTVGKGFLPPALVTSLRYAALVGFIIAIGMLFVFYVIGMLFAGVHIFRVRVLRQDLSNREAKLAAEDCWPFEAKEQQQQVERELGLSET